MKRRIIPGVIDGEQALCCLPRDATAHEAALLMRDRRVGAVMVVEDGRLKGIVTERDMVFRLLAEDRDAQSTLLGRHHDPRPRDADLRRQCAARAGQDADRSIPPPSGRGRRRISGMVSIRDLYEAVRLTLQEELHSAESLIYGEQYGATAT